MSDPIVTRSSIYSRLADGIIAQRNLPKIEQSLDDARENIAAYNRLADGQVHALFVDARELHGQARGVRELYAAPEAMRYVSAIAIVTKTSGPGRLIANVFISLGAPKAPTRLFGDEDSALAWLHKFVRIQAQSQAQSQDQSQD